MACSWGILEELNAVRAKISPAVVLTLWTFQWMQLSEKKFKCPHFLVGQPPAASSPRGVDPMPRQHASAGVRLLPHHHDRVSCGHTTHRSCRRRPAPTSCNALPCVHRSAVPSVDTDSRRYDRGKWNMLRQTREKASSLSRYHQRVSRGRATIPLELVQPCLCSRWKPVQWLIIQGRLLANDLGALGWSEAFEDVLQHPQPDGCRNRL
ncbi:MAG: hypothetical protein RLZZ618_2412 [Pseudomonadota bacterium]